MQKLMLIFIISMMPMMAFAYPNFIGKGYHACLTCHYNPFGNGPLNDYGRGVAATALSGRLFVSDKTSDEVLSERSGFLFNNPKNTWFRPALDWRKANYDQDWEDDEDEVKEITMQLDANITMLFGKAKEWIVSFTYGQVPADSIPNGLAAYDVEKGNSLLFSREHYVGKRITPDFGVYLGKMDKVFGIRVPDHTAFSRTTTNNNQYASTHGVVLHYGKEKFDAGFQYFIGDQEKLKEFRSSGFAGKFEYSITETSRLGINYQKEDFENETKTSSNALTFKKGIGKGSSILFEYGFHDTDTAGTMVKSQYAFLQNHILLRKGLYFLMTFDQLNQDTSTTSNTYKIAPGIQWFPIQRVEIRADVINKKVISTTTAPPDEWSTLVQMHLWF